MLLSIALMLLLGMMMGWICKKAHLPGLIGMLMTGIVLGPYALDLIDASILEISAELRKIALIIILTRAGLSLDLEDLKRVGRPAVLMCFVPACFEILGMVFLAPKLLGVSVVDAAVMGGCRRGGFSGCDCAQNASTDGRRLWDPKEYSANDSCGSFCG